MRFLFLLSFFFFIQLAHAGSIFDVLDGTYIDSVEELPQSEGTPEKKWQCQGNICAWVDVVGFSPMVRENGIDYIHGNPVDYAIIKYDARAELKSRVVTDYRANCYWCAVDSITKTVSVMMDGGNLTATLTVVLKWHETLENGQTIFYTNTAVFQDTEVIPKTYDVHIENLTAEITEYNNSISQKTSILVDLPPYISKMEYRYGDNLTTYRSSIGTIEKTSKGIYFMNISRSSTWEMKGMSRMGNHVIIKSANISYSLLKLTAHTFFEEKEITNYSITRIDYTPETTWHPFLFYFAGLLAIFSAGTYKLIRRM